VPVGLRHKAAAPARAERGLYAERLNVNFRDRRTYHFRLRDSHGGLLDERTLRGRPYVLTFLYTHCLDTCPLIGAELRQALADLGPLSRRVSAVGVSVDPSGDTVASVRSWLSRLHEPPNFHYLVGRQRELVPVWNAYFIDEQLPAFADGTHTSVVYLVDAGGVLRGSYNGAAPINPRHVAHDLRTLLAQRSPA